MSRAIFTLRVLLSHWARHPMQLATLLVGLAAATALWSGVQAINVQARTSYDRAAASFGGATAPMLLPTQTSTVPQSTFAALRRVAGWCRRWSRAVSASPVAASASSVSNLSVCHGAQGLRRPWVRRLCRIFSAAAVRR